MRFIKKILKNEKGQSIVEMAISLPIILLILCGIIDFGWIFSNQLILNNCSRESARYGAVHATDTNVYQNVTNKAKAVVPDFLKEKITVTTSFSNALMPRSGDITVTVSTSITALTPIAGVFTSGESLNLSSKVVMKAE